MVDTVCRTPTAADSAYQSPERAQILELCRFPVTVAELSAVVALPLGVVRVVLDDLLRENQIEVTAAAPRGRVTDMRLLRQVANALRAL